VYMHIRSGGFVLSFALLLAACAPSSAPTPAASSAGDAPAARDLVLYRTLREQKSWELAEPVGQEIATRYPQSAAAKEVAQTLADTTAKAGVASTSRRLQRLWTYQSGKESGGEQSTASIYSNADASGDRVRLILRRHSAWGQSVYLFGNGKGFVCRGTCRLAVRFDQQPEQEIKAYLPPTGEPAMFIADDKTFINRLAHARKISIDVIQKEKGARMLVFEVGGFQAEKFLPVTKKK
jgi:hypothetical protein